MTDPSNAKRIEAERYYMILAGIFIAALVACNLIFQKFFTWTPFGLYTFEISVGILPYPITFLVTDIISEIYGRRRADQVVLAGLVSSVFVLALVVVANLAPATGWSPVKDEEFRHVFGLTGISVAASMVAYLTAQFIDIRIYHFWKEVTKGKHLWLRNNASTITSQFVDTLTVLVMLCGFGIIGWERFWLLFVNGFLFKVIIALCDTPFLYAAVWFLRKRLGLSGSEEVSD